VFCYILYHTHVLCLLPPRIALLQYIEDISDKSKIKVLLPVLLALNQGNRSVQPESPAEQFASLLVASFDLSALSALNDTKGPLWDVVVAIVQHYLQPGMFILKFACYGTDMHHFIGRFSCGT
jgi:U3 small nucleolar RNA-associated protein 10